MVRVHGSCRRTWQPSASNSSAAPAPRSSEAGIPARWSTPLRGAELRPGLAGPVQPRSRPHRCAGRSRLSPRSPPTHAWQPESPGARQRSAHPSGMGCGDHPGGRIAHQDRSASATRTATPRPRAVVTNASASCAPQARWSVSVPTRQDRHSMNLLRAAHLNTEGGLDVLPVAAAPPVGQGQVEHRAVRTDGITTRPRRRRRRGRCGS